jgi:hypothetical protein
VWESFEDLGRGLGGQERKRSDGSKEKKKKTSLFGGKIDMNFFLKKKTRIWDLFCFSLVFYLWWVGVVAFF